MTYPAPFDGVVAGADRLRTLLAEIIPERGAKIGHFIVLAERVDDGRDWDTLMCCGVTQIHAPTILRDAAAGFEDRARRTLS